MVSAPALQRRWWAGAGEGAFDRPFAGRATAADLRFTVADLGSAPACRSPVCPAGRAIGARDRFLDLTDAVWRVRAYGDFWSYCLLAEGAVDIAAEPEVSLWDLAALDIVVRESGGRFTDLTGAPGPHGGSAVATNGRLHNAVLAYLA